MKRRVHEEDEVGELNIVPYLDIVTNLVMFMLLSMTGLITLGVVNVSAPRIGGEPAAAQAQGQDQPKLLLTVAVSRKGFYIAGAGGVLGGAADQASVDATQPPTVALKPDGKHDYAALTDKMKLIKDRYPNETNLILSADADVPYEVLIQTMDACRETRAAGPEGSRPQAAVLRRLAVDPRVGHLCQTARDGCARVDLTSADNFNNPVAVFARLDHLAADFKADFVDHSQDVSFCNGGSRSHDKIWASQGIEMSGVVGEVKARIQQLSQQFRRTGRIDVVDGVSGLCSGHVVCFWTHPTDAVGQQRHLLHRPAQAESFKSPQLRDLEIGVGDLAIFVQEDLYFPVAFEPCDRINRDSLHGIFLSA